MSDNHSNRIEASGASDQDLQAVHGRLLDQPEEPKQGYTLMPLFMLGFVSTMIFVVAIYFIHNRAGLTEGLGEATLIHHPGYEPGTADPPPPVEIDPIAQGERLYTQVCVACHQVNGMGLPPAFPPLGGVDYVTGDEDRLINILLHGLEGPIEVNGAPFTGLMPAFNETGAYNWSDDQISYVLTYIRQAFGNEASAISPEQVAEVRAATAGRGKALTAADL